MSLDMDDICMGQMLTGGQVGQNREQSNCGVYQEQKKREKIQHENHGSLFIVLNTQFCWLAHYLPSYSGHLLLALSWPVIVFRLLQNVLALFP